MLSDLKILFYSLFLLRCSKLLNKRMLWCYNHISCTEESVTTCCVYFKIIVALLKLKEYCSTFTSTDPVALHCLYRLRPIKIIQALEKSVTVGSDLKHPLSDVLFLDLSSASLASAFFYFFVCQSCLT